MFFGIDMEKVVIIAVVALLLLGPERLPRYAELLAKLTVRARDWLNGARTRVKDEMGEDFDDIEWRKLDPRQYDPRRIIRDALFEAPAPAPAAASAAPAVTLAAPAAPAVASQRAGRDGEPVPFDSEAT
jgi:sec-independent protein translocase protein TatB